MHPRLLRPRPTRCAWLLLGAAALPVVVRVARAEGEVRRACEQPRIEVSGPLAAPWLEAIDRSCRELTGGDDVDAAAQLRVSAVGQGVDVEITLADGRSARRHVSRPADFAMTVEAVVRVPRAAAPASAAPPATRDAESAPAGPSGAPSQLLSLEVGLGSTGRVSGGTRYLTAGVDGWLGLTSRSWLVALVARWEPLQSPRFDTPMDFDRTAAGGGVLVARHNRIARALSLDTGVTLQIFEVVEGYDAATAERTAANSEFRVGAVVRSLIGEGALRFTVSLDADLAPTHTKRDVRVADGFPVLPSWSLGVGFGVAWRES